MADYLIVHRVYEIGFCEYATDTVVFIDGEDMRFERQYTNVRPDEAVNFSLAEAVTFAQGIIGPDAAALIDSNGSPYVDWNTFNAKQNEEELNHE